MGQGYSTPMQHVPDTLLKSQFPVNAPYKNLSCTQLEPLNSFSAHASRNCICGFLRRHHNHSRARAIGANFIPTPINIVTMAPRQMSAGARPHPPAPVIRPRPCHHRIERPHAPSAVARAIAARRQAILYHQLPNELLASRVQEDSNMNCLMILRGLPLDIHSDQPPLPTTCDEEMDWYFNSGAYRRDQTLAMHDGRHVVRSASYLVEPMPAAHRVLQPPPAINHQQAASISSFPSVHQVPTQSTIPVGAQFSPPHPSLSPSAAPALCRPDIAVPAPIPEPARPVNHQAVGPNYSQATAPANPLPRLTAHALGMLEPAYSPTLLSWSEESSLDSSESSLVDSAESSDNSADSALVPEVDNPNPARIVPGLRLVWARTDICEREDCGALV